MEYFNNISIIVLSAAEIIMQLIVMMHILLTKHEETSSAILWLFAVLVVPVFGIAMYLVCGINRINTMGMDIKAANDIMNSEKNAPFNKYIKKYLENEHEFIVRFDKEKLSCDSYQKPLDRLVPDAIPLHGNKLELLQDGNMAYPKMLEAIEQAKNNIHLQSFIIVNDETGRQLFDTLERKAQAGVDVKVLYDRFGSGRAIFSHFFKRYTRRLPNMKVVPFSQMNLFTPWRIQLRNHRKLLITDGNIAFMGGINISAENIHADEPTKDKYIHDLHCKIEGPSVGQLQMSFLRDWCFAAEVKPSEVFVENYFPFHKAAGDAELRIVTSGPGHDYRASEKIFFTAASTAKKYIWIMTPYFVPDRAFIKMLCMASARGVEVRIIVPKNNNHWYVKYAIRSLYHGLLDNGIRIFEKCGSFSHAKAMIIDGEWGVMGSSNCDVRSFRLNYELDFIVSNCAFLKELHEQFEEELSESEEVSISRVYNKKLHVQLAENLCSLLTPVL